MRRFEFAIALFCIVLTGCAPAVTAAPSASDTPVLSLADTATPAPIKTLIPTSTLIPETLSPGTPTITPLPTIPTFTPTFDVRTMVTAMLAPKAVCPKENPSVGIDIEGDSLIYVYGIAPQPILDLLNKGLKPSLFLDGLDKKKIEYYYRDLTGDGSKDILVSGSSIFHVFYCHGGSYQLFTESRFYNLTKLEIMDLNKNSVPEIMAIDGITGTHASTVYMLDEWNGETFVDIAQNPETGMNPEISVPDIKYEFKDINRDGLKELILTGDGPWVGDMQARAMTSIYAWNGKFYAEAYTSYAPPQYRFQAVQDGDREVLYENYQKALSFYQEAIFSDKLEWWSPELGQYMSDTYYDNPTPTVYPTPIPDLSEYPRLAAYAYYRMVILHTSLGEMDSAQVKYATLQEKFPAGSPGHPYVEMATDFWKVYHSSGKIYNACAAAIAYADAHPDILTPLGDFYHGWQSHNYLPADVCPFR